MIHDSHDAACSAVEPRSTAALRVVLAWLSDIWWCQRAKACAASRVAAAASRLSENTWQAYQEEGRRFASMYAEWDLCWRDEQRARRAERTAWQLDGSLAKLYSALSPAC